MRGALLRRRHSTSSLNELLRHASAFVLFMSFVVFVCLLAGQRHLLVSEVRKPFCGRLLLPPALRWWKNVCNLRFANDQ